MKPDNTTIIISSCYVNGGFTLIWRTENHQASLKLIWSNEHRVHDQVITEIATSSMKYNSMTLQLCQNFVKIAGMF